MTGDQGIGERRRLNIFKNMAIGKSERRLSESDRVSDQSEAESVKADGRRDTEKAVRAGSL